MGMIVAGMAMANEFSIASRIRAVVLALITSR